MNLIVVLLCEPARHLVAHNVILVLFFKDQEGARATYERLVLFAASAENFDDQFKHDYYDILTTLSRDSQRMSRKSHKLMTDQVTLHYVAASLLSDPEGKEPVEVPQVGHASADGCDRLLERLAPQKICFAVCPNKACGRWMISLPGLSKKIGGRDVVENIVECPPDGHYNRFAEEHPHCPLCKTSLWRTARVNCTPVRRFDRVLLSSYIQMLLLLPEFVESLKNATPTMCPILGGTVADRLRRLGLFPDHQSGEWRRIPVLQSIDGVQGFGKRNDYSMWPIMVSLPTLSPHLQHEPGAKCLCGLLQGCKKKHSSVTMQLLLSSMVDEYLVCADGKWSFFDLYI